MKNFHLFLHLPVRNAVAFLILIFAFIASTLAQTPMYYNANSGGIGNSIPFNQPSGYKSQWLIGPGEYNQPAPAPSGNITKLYIYMSTTGNGTYTNLKIKLGQTAITSFTGEYTGQLDSVYFRASVALTSTINNWMVLTLDVPHSYNPAQSLVIEISHCGFTGSGMNVWQIAGTTGINRRNNIPGTTACVFTYSSQDSRILQCGVDVSQVSTASNNALLLPTPGVNTNYVMIPYNTGMVGFGNSITIEAWVKIGGTTTANTVLNKGAASFDYQLGINATTVNPFYRAGGTVVLGSLIVIPTNVWTHLAVTSDGSTVIFYVNGVAAQTVPTATTIGSSTGEMRVGRGNNDAGSGKIDELRLWSVARTASQISANMCLKWIPNNSTGLKANWHFDSTYVDSVNNWNGTPLGIVSFDTANNCVVTGIINNQTEVVKDFHLYQNYPNPFNPVTTIKFSISKSAYVEMKLYDISGKEVATLVSDPYQAGTYQVNFNGSKLSSGVYFYRIVAGEFRDTKKMILIK